MTGLPRGRALTVAVVMALTAACGEARTAPRTVEMTIEHSRFQLTRGTLPPPGGATVAFVVRNLDPIDHELIVGPIEVQRRHEAGHDPHHDGTDGAVSLPAGTTARTAYTFPSRGTIWLGCHLPGHWQYGMRLPVTVTS